MIWKQICMKLIYLLHIPNIKNFDVLIDFIPNFCPKKVNTILYPTFRLVRRYREIKIPCNLQYLHTCM